MKKFKITEVINGITLAGTYDLTQTLAKRVRTINTLCLITAILAFIFGNVFFWKTRSLSIEVPAMAEGLLFCLVIYLNHIKRDKLAGLLFISIFCISSLYFGAILGNIINLILITALLISVSFIIFQHWRTQLLSCAISLTTVVLSEIDLYNEWFEPIELNKSSQYLIRWIAMAVFLSLDVLVLAYFVNENNQLHKKQLKLIESQSELLVKLNDANKLTKTLFFKASHELRNQLNPLTLCIYLLQKMIKKYPELYQLKEVTDIMVTSMVNVGNMINNILNLSQIDAGKKYKPEYTTFNLRQKLEGIIQQHTLQAKQKGQNIVCDLDQDVPSIIVTDEVIITLAFTNIVNNAIKYSFNNSDIYVHISLINGNLKIAVQNRCEDIHPDIQKVLFDPFVRDERSKKAEGTGLGLSVVKTRMQAIHGDVKVKSNDGFTEFALIFPLTVGNEQDIEHDVDLDMDLSGIRILIVDDDNMSLMAMEKILTMIGCSVIQAENGGEVFTKIEKQMPDLIILDIHMPILNGEQTLEKLRSDPRFKKIPVIIASGQQFGSSFIDKWRALGACDAIQKPIIPKSLATILNHRLKPKIATTTRI